MQAGRLLLPDARRLQRPLSLVACSGAALFLRRLTPCPSTATEVASRWTGRRGTMPPPCSGCGSARRCCSATGGAARPTAEVTAVGRGSARRRGSPTPAVRRRARSAARRGAGHRQGRPRRAGRAGDDRGRRRRDRAVGGGPLGGAVARRPGRQGPRQVGGHRPGGGQAGPPRLAAGGGRRPGLLDQAGGGPAGRRRRGVRAARGGDRPAVHRRRCPPAGEIVLVVGPEGGISDAELAAFAAAGATAVRLGDSVLRTSTAGVAALSVLSARLGRW